MKGLLIVRKYKNRRLYDTERSVHITQEELLEVIRGGRDVQVQEVKTAEDVTVETLLGILLAEKGAVSRTLTPEFVHFLIRTDVDVLGRFFHDFLPGVTRGFQSFMQNVPGLPGFMPYNPFGNPWMVPFGGGSPGGGSTAPFPPPPGETEELRQQVQRLQEELDRIKKRR